MSNRIYHKSSQPHIVTYDHRIISIANIVQILPRKGINRLGESNSTA
jgi:hypothetical protein